MPKEKIIGRRYTLKRWFGRQNKQKTLFISVCAIFVFSNSHGNSYLIVKFHFHLNARKKTLDELFANLRFYKQFHWKCFRFLSNEPLFFASIISTRIALIMSVKLHDSPVKVAYTLTTVATQDQFGRSCKTSRRKKPRQIHTHKKVTVST